MKQLSFLVVIAAILFPLMLTGFQCGSAEATSAKLYIQRQDWENAEKALAKEVDSNPKNAEAWYLLGDVRRQKGDISGMMTAFNSSVQAGPEFADKIRLTRLSVWGNSFNLGVALYNKSLTVPQDTASFLRNKAVESYQKAVLVIPDSASTYVNLALTYRAERDYENEIRYLKMALERRKSPETSISLINAYIRKATDAKNAGKTAEASEYFGNAIAALTEGRASDPENQELLTSLIEIYIEADRAKEAVPLMREALGKNPDNKILQNNLGLLLLQTDEFEEAIQHFDRAVAVDSLYEDALWNGAIAYMRYGEKLKKDLDSQGQEKTDKSYVNRFKVAVGRIEKLVAAKPDEPKYWDGLATAYANAGMGKKAQDAFQKADALRKK